jgi:hypothetical protein
LTGLELGDVDQQIGLTSIAAQELCGFTSAARATPPRTTCTAD